MSALDPDGFYLHQEADSAAPGGAFSALLNKIVATLHDGTWNAVESNVEGYVDARLIAVTTNPTDSVVEALIRTASLTSAAGDKRWGGTMNAADHGIVGNGAINGGGADDSAALQALLNSAATFGARVLLEQGTKLRIVTPVLTPSNTRLDANGATIINNTAPIDGRPLKVQGVDNVSITGLNINGDKASYATATEQRHNLIVVNSSNVTLTNVYSYNAKGDGIYIGDNSQGISTNVIMERVRCDSNHRQGMSVSHVSGLMCTNSRFTGTAGTNPQAGVDIEPNVDGIACENIKFVNCIFDGNGHFGFVVALRAAPTARQGGIDLVNCQIRNNGTAGDAFGGGVNLRNSREFTMIGGSIAYNGGPGVLVDSVSNSINSKFVCVNINNNTTDGILVTRGVTYLLVEGCHITANGTSTPNVYSGITVTPSVAGASLGVRIIGNSITGSTQRYGVLTNANVSRLQLLGNDTAFQGTAPYSLGDDIATRMVWDGPNGMVIGDVALTRSAANVLSIGVGDSFKTGRAITASRPSATTVGVGAQFYDTTLSKPIWSNGSVWKDAAGTTV